VDLTAAQHDVFTLDRNGLPMVTRLCSVLDSELPYFGDAQPLVSYRKEEVSKEWSTSVRKAHPEVYKIRIAAASEIISEALASILGLKKVKYSFK
jgi:hypothetical protein